MTPTEVMKSIRGDAERKVWSAYFDHEYRPVEGVTCAEVIKVNANNNVPLARIQELGEAARLRARELKGLDAIGASAGPQGPRTR